MEQNLDSFRKHYFEALGTRAPEQLKDVCARAHQIRQFEIELYWKRATYFWAFQLIAFTALGFVLKDGEVKSRGLLLIADFVGVITAFAGYLTASGSKFWQENWEAHVDMLENEMGTRLTQVIMCPKSPPQFSVSRINQSLLLLLTLGWSIGFFCVAVPPAGNALGRLWASYSAVISVLAAVVACGWLWRSNRTHFAGRKYQLGDVNWTEYGGKTSRRAPSIIWRDALSRKRTRSQEAERRNEFPQPSEGNKKRDAH